MRYIIYIIIIIIIIYSKVTIYSILPVIRQLATYV